MLVLGSQLIVSNGNYSYALLIMEPGAPHAIPCIPLVSHYKYQYWVQVVRHAAWYKYEQCTTGQAGGLYRSVPIDM